MVLRIGSRTLALAAALIFATPAVADSGGAPAGKLEAIGLLKAGAYGRLEAWITRLQSGYQSGTVPEHTVGAAFQAFEFADPDIAAKLDAWVATMPRSYAALTARGAYRGHLAGIVRGTRSYAETSRNQIEGFVRRSRNAGADFEAALALNNRIAFAHSGLVRIASTTAHDRSRVRTLYEEGLAALGGSVSLHLAYLYTFLDPRWGGSVEAVDALFDLAESMKETDPSYRVVAAERTYNRAERLWAAGRYEEALPLADRLIEEHDSAPRRMLRHSILSGLNRYDETLPDLKRAAALAPQDPSVAHHLGMYYNRLNRFETGLKYLNTAVSLDPYNPYYLASRAIALQNLGRIDAAEADYERTLVFGGGDPRIHRARAAFFGRIKRDIARGAAALGRVAALEPMERKNWERFMRALILKGDCGFLAPARQHLGMCLMSGECGNTEARLQSYFIGQSIVRLGCEGSLDMRDMKAYVLGRSHVLAMQVEGLRIGQTVEDVERAAPDIPITARRVPGLDAPAVTGTLQAPDRSSMTRVIFDEHRTVATVQHKEVLKKSATLEGIWAEILKRFGRPDRVDRDRDRKSMRISYSETDGVGTSVAGLDIVVQFGRHVRIQDLVLGKDDVGWVQYRLRRGSAMRFSATGPGGRDFFKEFFFGDEDRRKPENKAGLGDRPYPSRT